MSQEDVYQDALANYGPSLGRLASGCQADPEKRRDLTQESQHELDELSEIENENSRQYGSYPCGDGRRPQAARLLKNANL